MYDEYISLIPESVSDRVNEFRFGRLQGRRLVSRLFPAVQFSIDTLELRCQLQVFTRNTPHMKSALLHG